MRYYPILLTIPVVAACGQSYEPGATYQADAHGNLVRYVQAPPQVIVQAPVVQPQAQQAQPAPAVPAQTAQAPVATQQAAPQASESNALAAGVAGAAIGAAAGALTANALADRERERARQVYVERQRTQQSAPPAPSYRPAQAPAALPTKPVPPQPVNPKTSQSALNPFNVPKVDPTMKSKLNANQPQSGYGAKPARTAIAPAAPKVTYTFRK